MFKKIIEIENTRAIRYGQTEIGYYQTQTAIMKLLKKHGCNEILIHEKDGVLLQLPQLLHLPPGLH